MIPAVDGLPLLTFWENLVIMLSSLWGTERVSSESPLVETVVGLGVSPEK